jgi:hypothetical protein
VVPSDLCRPGIPRFFFRGVEGAAGDLVEEGGVGLSGVVMGDTELAEKVRGLVIPQTTVEATP